MAKSSLNLTVMAASYEEAFKDFFEKQTGAAPKGAQLKPIEEQAKLFAEALIDYFNNHTEILVTQDSGGTITSIKLSNV